MTQDRFSRRILDHLADQRYRPRHTRELADDLGISEDDLEEFHRSVQRLVDAGELVLGSSDTVGLPPPGREMTGLFRLNERGFGFIMPDSAVQHGDLFVPPGDTGGAMTGDRVRAKVIHERGRATAGRSPFVGRVVEVIQRAEKRYVGNLLKRGSHFVVEVDGRVLRQPVVMRDPHAKNAKLGDKVVIELLEYPTEETLAEGVITEVLGEQGEPEVETVAVMRAYGLPDKFPPEVVEQARAAARTFHEGAAPPDREDLTREFICTIDPPDAKDFDDAISIRRLEERGAAWELGIHIADVSHFVKPGTALDSEAQQRGNSAYLPRRVVPMLPELLSNGVCSLQEGVNRFCKSAFIRFDAQGNVVGQRFANTVIRSAKRLTYLEAQALIDDDLREALRHSKTETKYPPQLVPTLKLMDELARVIRERRLRQGMIVLGLPEVELIFDDSGRVVDAEPEDDAFTHTIIEMFMVEANEAVARLFDSLHVPMIRRIHPDPDAHDITELRQFARVAGYNIPARPSRKELQALLDAVRGKPQQHAVHLAVLKTLSKAEYSPLLIGHFALASEHYTHFTSPIRRYPDLVVHRGLDAYFDAVGGAGAGFGARGAGRGEKRPEAEGAGGIDEAHEGKSLPRPAPRPPHPASREQVARRMADDPRCPDEERLTELGRHCSGTERNAEAAEGDLRNYLVLDLLSDKLGDDFDGTVTGVTGAGVFVQIDRYLVDGFIRINDLPGQAADRWRLNRTTGALVAQRSGKTITIGDRFVVRVASVNPEARQMELVVIGEINTDDKAPSKRRQPKGARQGHQRTMDLKRQKQRRRKGR